MALKHQLERKILQDVMATDDLEIQCRDAEKLIARCVDSNLSEEVSRKLYPELWHHFHYCPNCAEEYTLMMELAELEVTGDLSVPTQIPAMPNTEKTDFWKKMTQAITALFPGFSPETLVSIERGESPATEPTEIYVVEGSFTISCDVARNHETEMTRDLSCQFESTESSVAESLEGILVYLQKEGVLLQEEVIGELGGVNFIGLMPGQYSLHFKLAGKDYAITGITIP